jgi:carbonic anhydrase/acetyltransferase-like protein (isoleucine patch superfamily)
MLHTALDHLEEFPAMTGTILPFDGMTPRVAADAFVAETATLIGDVEVGAGSSIWYGCVLRADLNSIRVGRNTNIQDGTIVHCNHDPDGDYRETGGGMPTHIGGDVTIGHLALIHACTLEDESFVGMRAVVMDLAVVESRAMLAAGALLTPGKRVPSGQLWAGSPARYVRDLKPGELDEMAYLTRHYVKLGAAYRAR